MPRLGEIWYFERSLAAPLARPLSRRYALRALPRSTRGRRTVLPSPGEARIVCLADLAGNDLPILRRLARSESRVRLIGISQNGADGEHAARCFATLPYRAASKLVRKTVDAAFDNIEITQRERAARAELKRTERDMEELNRIGVALSETRNVSVLLEMILSKARQITRADAGSLYLVEETRPDALDGGAGGAPSSVHGHAERQSSVSLSRNSCFRCTRIPWRDVPRCEGKSSILPMRIASRVDVPTGSTRVMTRKPAIGRAPCSRSR